MGKKWVDESIGWYGTFAIILAYALSSFNILSPSSITYQILNATGAIGIIYISSKKEVYQSVVLNIIWLTIALIAVALIVLARFYY
jgi:hypothetical protein